MKLKYDDLQSIRCALSKVDLSIPIKKYPADAYTREDVREIVTIMRRLLDDVAANPALEEVYETKGKDWQDEYATMTALADNLGIEL